MCKISDVREPGRTPRGTAHRRASERANDLGKRCLNCGIGARPTAAIAEFRPRTAAFAREPLAHRKFCTRFGSFVARAPAAASRAGDLPAPPVAASRPVGRKAPRTAQARVGILCRIFGWSSNPRAKFAVGPAPESAPGPSSAAHPSGANVGPGQSSERDGQARPGPAGRARAANQPKILLRTRKLPCARGGAFARPAKTRVCEQKCY